MNLIYNRKVQLVSKLLLFSVLILWDFVFNYVALILGVDFVIEMAEEHGDVLAGSWLSDSIAVWYAITCIVIGVYVAKRAISIVINVQKVEEDV